MADLPVGRLVVKHHDDTESVYDDVTYCPWGGGGGVTVYRDGAQIARHDDVLTVYTEPLVTA